MTFAILLWWLVVGHFVADYPLQSDSMAREKNRHRPLDPARIPPGQTPQVFWPWVLTAHAMTHGAAVGLAMWLAGLPGGAASLLAGAETLAHWSIDWGKCEGFYGIHQDQCFHLWTKAIWACLAMVVLSLLD